MAGRVLIYGGKGALGSICVNFFKSKNFVSPLFFPGFFLMKSLKVARTRKFRYCKFPCTVSLNQF